MIRASIHCLLLAILLNGPAMTQPKHGDLVLGDIGSPYQVLVLDREDFTFSSLGPATMQYQNWVTMAKDNSSLVVALSGAPNDALAILTSGGFYWHFADLGTSGSPNGIDLNQDGQTYIVSSSTLNNLRVVTLGGQVHVYPLSAIPATLNNVCIDQDTGNYILGVLTSGLLLELDVATNQLRTIASGLSSVTSVDFEPRTGNFVVTTFTAPQLRVISRTGKVVTTMRTTGDNAVKVDDQTGNYYVVGGSNMFEITPTGTTINTWSAAGESWTSVDVYGSKQITGMGSAKAGTRYRIDLSYRGMGNSVYITGMALSMRPGIPIQWFGTLNLAPDVLFFTTLFGLNPMVTGFSGYLDPAGNATAFINLPSYLPPGITLFVSGIAFTTARFQVANAIGITVR